MKTWKLLVIFLAIIIPVTIIITLLAINFNGWGASVSQSTSGFTSGLQKMGAYIPNMMLQNGYIMLLIYIAVPALVFGFALLYSNKDWGYILQPQSSSNAASNYDNTMKREPEEPERSNTPVTA
jgi:hypothetical protein